MSANYQILNKYIKSCLKTIVFKNLAHGEGVGDVFHVLFLYTHSTEDVYFEIERVIIYCNEPHICYFFMFSLHVTSSSNITSVYSVENIPEVKKTIITYLLGN